MAQLADATPCPILNLDDSKVPGKFFKQTATFTPGLAPQLFVVDTNEMLEGYAPTTPID